MADVKKIATRDSYGKALAELGDRTSTTWWCWTPTWPAPPRPAVFKKALPRPAF